MGSRLGLHWGLAVLVVTLAIVPALIMGSRIDAQQQGVTVTAATNTTMMINATGTQTALPPAGSINVTETATNIVNATVNTTTTANITTVTVVSYITLPPVTRSPTNIEIARWISGGAIAGILVGLSIGYAFFAKGVSIKKQQIGKGAKATERGEKRRRGG